MKKLLSLALALTLCLSLTVPAFAEEKKEDKADTTVTDTETKTPAEGEEDKEQGEEDKTPAEGEEDKEASKDEEKEPVGTEGNTDLPAGTPETTDPAVTVAPKFTDVAATSPFAAAIDWAVAEGITNGTTPTTFGPSNTCSISNIITFLWRANGKPGAAEGVADRDSAAAWAKEKRMIADEDVSAPCTRLMAVALMWIAAGEPEVEAEVSFTDLVEGADYMPSIAWAVENGVTTGTSETTFSPDNTCTRGQIVTFLYRAANAASASAEQAAEGQSAE